jgi:predicted TPR repeat methyltransferase
VNARKKRPLDGPAAAFYKGFMDLYFGGSSGDLLADRRYDMALRLAEMGDFQAAADLLADSIAMAPDWPPIHFHLGDCYRRLGRAADAEAALRRYLALDPADRMGAGIKLSLMGLAEAGTAMTPDYVRSLFDQYAPRFESALVGHLDYKTPEKMAQTIRSHAKGRRFSRLLDLGCGTGLMAAALAGSFDAADGVDIAPAMIREAQAKKLYAELHTAPVEEFLGETQNRYDLAAAADVFVYIGPLERVFEGLSRVLLPGGLFCFSVQTPSAALDHAVYHLGADHRYAHGAGYLQSCFDASGFKQVAAEQNIALRLDAGEPVIGAVYLVEKL